MQEKEQGEAELAELRSNTQGFEQQQSYIETLVREQSKLEGYLGEAKRMNAVKVHFFILFFFHLMFNRYANNKGSPDREIRTGRERARDAGQIGRRACTRDGADTR